eukprot:12846529-Alexandrium_andersonii.AAC.1
MTVLLARFQQGAVTRGHASRKPSAHPDRAARHKQQQACSSVLELDTQPRHPDPWRHQQRTPKGLLMLKRPH